MVEAKFAMGDFNQMVLNNADKAQIKAKARKDNVAGIFYCCLFLDLLSNSSFLLLLYLGF